MNNEKKVAKFDDLKDGEMKEVVVEDDKSILLVRLDGKYYALGAKCTHEGAPLEEGVISEGRIRCPWHQACFKARTGDVIEPPALDSLPQFDIRIENDDVILILPEEFMESRTSKMARFNPEVDKRKFVIIGSGAAGNAAAEALRQNHFQGRVVILTREDDIPYDRTYMSKAYLRDPRASIPALRPEDFYTRYDIELLRNHEVVNVALSDKTVIFKDNSSLTYDKLLVATGGTPRRLDVPGSDLQNIFTLRSLADATRIKEKAKESKRCVVVGASFIGMETAAALVEYDLSITVVAPESVPFEKTLGTEIGEMFQKQHEDKGIFFMLNTGVERFEGDEKVNKVVLSNSMELDTDFVVMGIGVKPGTDFITGLELQQDGSIPVDEYLSAAEDVYAAGDIASFIDWRTGERIRIEHWRLAEQLGRTTALNMVGNKTKFCGVPFFWTRQLGIGLQYVGYTKGWDEIVFHGDVSRKKFLAYYVKGDRVMAVAGCEQEREMAGLAELMHRDLVPKADEIKSGSLDILSRL